jgi:uncharacterized protein YjbI with pentapeptide repeats
MNNNQPYVPPQPFQHLNEPVRNIPQAQEIIYAHLVKIVQESSPEAILAEFKNLFIHPINENNSPIINAVYNIAFENNEQEFLKTLKRSCYIVINNWCLSRKRSYIQQLIDLFSENHSNINHTSSLPLKRLKIWIANFVNSQDFQDISLFASAYITITKTADKPWKNRYAAYLLAPQYVDTNNPIEQREAAQEVAKQLKEKFKLDLAMYTAHAHSAAAKESTAYENPTQLGDEALGLIKRILLHRGIFSYSSLAHIFLEQNQQVNHKIFKRNLKKYLMYSLSLGAENLVTTVGTELDKKLEHLYESYQEKIIDDDLLLRTCNHVIDFFTTENRQEPSPLFLLFLSHGERLSLVIILLKTVLLCKNARAHVEEQIANLIRYYENYTETECQGVINFLEIFNMAFTMYTEDVEYNLVQVNQHHLSENSASELDTYRIFSQLKSDLNLAGYCLRHSDLHGVDLSHINLQSADLYCVNLSDADLSQANLSQANLSNANLSNAELITANLLNANLSNVNLQGADIRRANLSGANLSEANLSIAKLRLANLNNADLRRANLCGANLNHATLKGANLRGARLRHAHLSGADLRNADLSSADLSGVDLSGADLSNADLSNANLRYASLKDAKLCDCNLNGTDLSRTELMGADFSNTDFEQAKVQNAHWGNNCGVSPAQMQILQQRGAILTE